MLITMIMVIIMVVIMVIMVCRNHGGDDDEHADKEGPCKLVCRPEVCELLNDTMYDVSCEASGT